MSVIDGRTIDTQATPSVPNYITLSDSIIKMKSLNDTYITRGLLMTSSTTIYFYENGALKWSLLRNLPNTGGANVARPIGDVCYINGVFWYLILKSTVTPISPNNEQYALMGINRDGDSVYDGSTVNNPALISTMNVIAGFPSLQVRAAAGYGPDIMFFISKMDVGNTGVHTRATVHVNINNLFVPAIDYSDENSTVNPGVAGSLFDDNCDAVGISPTTTSVLAGFSKIVFLYLDVSDSNTYKVGICKATLSANSTNSPPTLALTPDPQSISVDPLTKDLWILNAVTSELRQQTVASDYVTTGITDITAEVGSDGNPPRCIAKANVTV